MGDRVKADQTCGGWRPRSAVRPALHKGTALCRARRRAARAVKTVSARP